MPLFPSRPRRAAAAQLPKPAAGQLAACLGSACLSAACLLSPAGPAQAQAQAGVPGVDALFDSMAIDVAAGRQARFLAGDNLDGYYAGMTQGSGNGEGYVTRAGIQLLDYASTFDGAVLERKGAAEQVLPWGHRLRYPNGASEELALLARRHAMAMQVAAPASGLARLAIAPLLRAPGAIARVGDAVLVAPQAGDQLFVALIADQPFELAAGLLLRTRAPAASFTVIAAVGVSAAEALARARALDPANAIASEKATRHAALTRSYLATSDATYNKALNWARASAGMFVVDEFGAGIWAGLPWFRDNWGRDTFIALPGTLLVNGQFAQAKAVLANFARYQQRDASGPHALEYGRIPNRVSANAPVIYNTVDGTPWMLREALEYIRYTGDQAFAAQMYKLAVPYFEGAIANYVDADGLLRHDSADTWMDARIANEQPWSPRGPRAVEIQALWYTALQTGAALARQAGQPAQADAWAALAAKTRKRFLAAFWNGAVMADRLRADGSADRRVRPNQLMLVSIPFDDFIAPAVQAQIIKNANDALLYPYGITSLSDRDAYFHPRHENPAYHHKDAAYHQGTIWGWNAGFTVTALDKFGYQDHAYALSKNLGRQILGIGPEGAHATLGSMSELLDAVPADDGTLKPSGTYAQSWSVAEYARNGFQDYLGFRPDLTAGRLRFVPALPAAWTSLYAQLPFGAGESLEVRYRRGADADADATADTKAATDPQARSWRLLLAGAVPRTVSVDLLDQARRRLRVEFVLAPGKQAVLTIDGGRSCRAGAPARQAALCVALDGQPLATRVVQQAQTAILGTLRFRTPPAYVPADFPMLRSRDALKNIILEGRYQ